MTTLYIKTTLDKYELPLAVADTARELAKMCNVKPESIYSAMSHYKANGWNCAYKKVVIEDD